MIISKEELLEYFNKELMFKIMTFDLFCMIKEREGYIII